MKTCDDVRGRLEEYFDGELRGSEAAAIEAHVGTCVTCAKELAELRRLEDVLKAAPAAERPDGDRYLMAVRARLQSRGRWTVLVPLAAAAAMLVGMLYLLRPTDPPSFDVTAHLDQYMKDPSARASIERELNRPDALAALKQTVLRGTARHQQTAAVILAKRGDMREWLVDSTKTAGSQDVELLEIGAEATDDELVGAAFELLRSPKTQSDAIGVLRKLRRGGYNQRVDGAIIARVKWLFASPSPSEQKLGLEIMGRLDVKFPLPDVADLLEVPELADEAHKLLKQQTGKDYGRDKEAWAQFFGRIN